MSIPNLLFIFTDEQRFDTFADGGNTQIDMPNLNRLAAQSVVFERAYCTQPICTPDRSTLLSGLYPHTNGCIANNIPLPAETPCLPEMIEPNLYTTGYYGKWHLGDEIFAQHGFTDWVSIEDLYIDHYSKERSREARSDYHHFLVKNGFTPDPDTNIFSRGFAARLPEKFGKPAFLAQEASNFIREHQSEPFILYINFLEPHMPFFGPRDDQYNPNDIPLPANFHNPPAEDQHVKYQLIQQAYYERGHSGLPLKTEADWHRMIANYWGLNSLVDTHLGTILNTLEECNLTSDTIVVFTSDHGDMMGSHQMLAKCVMFEEAVRVPLMVRLPGQTEQRHISRPVGHIDIVPTLLDLMGQPVPGNLPGKSLKTEMTGGAEDMPEDVFIQFNSSETGILEPYRGKPLPENLAHIASAETMEQAITDPLRTVVTPDGWKFTFSQLGQHELYNLRGDPYETNNLAFEPEMQAKVAELVDKIHAWQVQYQDIIDPVTLH